MHTARTNGLMLLKEFIFSSESNQTHEVIMTPSFWLHTNQV